jgi:imidazolonepropionase-like amidohydrolase
MFQLLAQPDVLVLKGGQIITVTQGVIEEGTIVIKDGKIDDIGKNISIPENSQVIDVSSCTVLPGFIDSFTNLGTKEIEANEKDYDEATHPVMPHLRIIDALNPENSFILLARRQGITAALSAPGEGNLLSGQSALIHPAGEYTEDMVLQFPAAVHASLGELPVMRYREKGQLPSTRMGAAALLRQTLIDAVEYKKKLDDYQGKKNASEKGINPPEADLKLQSLIPVLERQLPLVVRANRYDDILTALRIADEFDLRIILNHGAQAYRAAETLASRNIPVLIGPFSSYYQKMETKNAEYTSAAELNKAGVKFAFQTGGVENISTLLTQARTAVKYGLPIEAAYKGMTLYPAQIFGVDDKLGSLEKGKIADIVVFSGEPLQDIAEVKLVIIGGEVVEKEK